jgi:hypothetical protein
MVANHEYPQYAGLNIAAFVLIFFFVPETKQRTLEELDQVSCSVPRCSTAQFLMPAVLLDFCRTYRYFHPVPDEEGPSLLDQAIRSLQEDSYSGAFVPDGPGP